VPGRGFDFRLRDFSGVNRTFWLAFGTGRSEYLDMDDFNPFDLTFTDPNHPFHIHHMEMCLQEAAVAADEDEVPIGALIVHPELGTIALAHNMRERLNDPTQAGTALKSWRLEGCILYVTLEPCPMCAGAIVQARMPMVVYGCTDPKAGACHTLYQIPSDSRLNHRAVAIGGVLADRCSAILSDFFQEKRRQGKK
jgi:tRNA(adenine34) deaminase